MTVATEFDLCGPLPSGVTVLEASAGTGKTFAIAALAARYVAAGTPVDQLLLVTFTRMATGELRERVRERLVSAEHGLAAVLAGAAPPDDEVLRLLAAGSQDDVRARHARLARAVADFDAATIATTHAFCQEMLNGLGIAGDLEEGVTFVEDIRDLRDEVVDDLYVRRFHPEGEPPFDRRQAGHIAKAVVDNPAAAIAEPDGGDVPAMRVRLAHAIRAELDRRKRRMSVMTYDDLQGRLAEALRGPGAAVAAKRLRERFSVVLVDEFQDTDPVQWEILRRAFAEDGATTLILIGDPKQAIYAFRGADVYAYVDAAATAGTQRTLQVNRRSDQPLIDAYDALFGGARLGHERIVYRPVRSAPANVEPRLKGTPVTAPLRLRVLRRDAPELALTNSGAASAPSARERIACDLAADVVALLESGARIDTRAADSTTIATEAVRPGHLAVLTRTNHNAATVRDALAAAGVPAVISGAGSVFATDAAADWLRLLESLERPASPARARAAALTAFLGWSAERVAGAGDDEWEDVHRRLHGWARVLRTRGVASLAEAVTIAETLPERLLGDSDGERRMTDLRHVAQLLHAAAATEQLGTTALAGWLRRRVAEAERDTADEERSRRLESDAEAVQVLTIHRSKGLEFPIVFYPDLWEPGRETREGEPVVFHDPGADDARTVDVSLQGPAFMRNKRLHVAEQRGEDLRLAYVALTRARHQAVVWWAPSYSAGHSPLGRLLFARDEAGNVEPLGPRTPPPDDVVVERLRRLAATAPAAIAVELAAPGISPSWAPAAREAADLAIAAFDRDVDRGWRRTSFSDITAGAHEPRVASEPETGAPADEPAGESPPPAPSGDAEDGRSELRTVACALSAMPAGVEVGTLVHRVFEGADFTAGDLEAELTAEIAAAQAWRSVELGDRPAVVTGLRAAIETPLGSLVGGLRLRDIARSDRLDELEFELPLAGGDRPAGLLTPAAIAALLREHLAAGDPLAAYAARLEDPDLRRSVRGYLTGSIDLVFRVRAPDGEPRFAIADYKTNRLAAHGEELTAWHHRPAALAAEMRRGHYGLQALLYTVALHRYLSWRLPGYDPDRHLAGVLYLFVRGMGGPGTPVVDGAPCGVFAWRPPGALVRALSDLLDTGVAR